MNRVDRLLGYLLMFQSRGLVRAQDFAAEFEISERTVYRDINALGEVGVPIAAMPGEGYRLMEGYYLPPIMFSEAEARALSLAVSMLTGLTADGPTKQAAGSALEKIRAILPQPVLGQIEALTAVLGFYTIGQPPLRLDDTMFVQLQQAIQQQRVVHIHYHALHSNQVTEREVEPYHLAYVERAWLLSGYCRLRQAQRNFRLNRIDALKVKPDSFTPREFVLGYWPDEAWRVVVRFDSAVVRWVQEDQHFTFAEEIDDGDADAVMVYRVQTLQQIVGWLLRWGSQMEVLEPPELRVQITELAAGILKRHQ